MTLEREKEIQDAIVEVMSKLLKPDLSDQYPSISPVGLHQMLGSIPRDEFVAALKKWMASEGHSVRNDFTGLALAAFID